MTFALVPSLPVTDDVDKLDASTANAWRVAISQAGDFTGGTNGTPYTPLTQIGVGGAGFLLTGSTALELDATSVSKLDSGGAFNIFGTVNVQADGLISLAGSGLSHLAKLYLGAFSKLEVASLVQFDNASQATWLSGSVAEISAGAELQLFGTQTVESTGQIVVSSSGVIAVQSGGIVDVLGGGILKVESTGEIEVKSGGTLQGDAGSTVTLAGTNALSGATTQTGLYTKSGTGGRTALRTTTLNSDSNLNVDPSQWDFIEIDASGFTADRTWTFTAPPGGICCTVMLKANTSNPWSHGLTIGGGIVGPNGGLFVYNPGAGGQFSGWNLLVYDPIFAEWRGIGVPFNAINTPY